MSRNEIKKKLKRILQSRVHANIPLSKLTSYRVGGPADFLVSPKNYEELSLLVKFINTNSLSFYIIGNGTNILASDEGFKGILISLKKLRKVRHDNVIVEAEAGADLNKLILYSIKHNLAGLQHLSGIPGTVGGALRMNAGAYESEISNSVIGMEIMDYFGNIMYVLKKKVDFEYRKARKLENKIILKAWFKLVKGKKQELMRKRKEIINLRKQRQPWQDYSAGSVFKRPIGSYAGFLIERAGLKGYRIGDAEVSQKHAGFIINKGKATGSDIRALIKLIQQKVYSKFRIKLKLEQILLE